MLGLPSSRMAYFVAFCNRGGQFALDAVAQAEVSEPPAILEKRIETDHWLSKRYPGKRHHRAGRAVQVLPWGRRKHDARRESSRRDQGLPTGNDSRGRTRS